MNTIDIDYVRNYYSNIFDLLLLQRRKFTYAKFLYQLRSELTFDKIDKEIYLDDVSYCKAKIDTNKVCMMYLSEIFSMCNNNNYINIYNTGSRIINVYDQNIDYYDGEIKKGNYVKMGIKYSSNLDYEEDFKGYAEEEYQKIKKI